MCDFLFRGSLAAFHAGYFLIAFTSIPVSILSSLIAYCSLRVVKRNSILIFLITGFVISLLVVTSWLLPVFAHNASYSFEEIIYWKNGHIQPDGWNLIIMSLLVHFFSTILGGSVYLQIIKEIN